MIKNHLTVVKAILENNLVGLGSERDSILSQTIRLEAINEDMSAIESVLNGLDSTTTLSEEDLLRIRCALSERVDALEIQRAKILEYDGYDGCVGRIDGIIKETNILLNKVRKIVPDQTLYTENT